MAFATREEFFSLAPRFKDIDVPELGEGKQIRVVELGSKDKVRYGLSIPRTATDDPNFENARAIAIVWSCEDDKGNKLFTMADVDAINRYPGAVIERLTAASDELSGLYSQALEIRELFNQAQK